MTLFVKHIDLATMRHKRVALPRPPASFTLGAGRDVDLVLPGYEGERPVRLVNESGPWFDGDATTPRFFAPGDVHEVGDHLLVFLDRPEAVNPELEAAIDAAPDDGARFTVRRRAPRRVRLGRPALPGQLSRRPATTDSLVPAAATPTARRCPAGTSARPRGRLASRRCPRAA